MPHLAFSTAQARSELLQQVILEAQSKTWKEEEEKESAGLMADENMFYSRYGKLFKKGAQKGGIIKNFSRSQYMVYSESSSSANRNQEQEPPPPIFQINCAGKRKKTETWIGVGEHMAWVLCWPEMV
jgi:hypothetical protein